MHRRVWRTPRALGVVQGRLVPAVVPQYLGGNGGLGVGLGVRDDGLGGLLLVERHPDAGGVGLRGVQPLDTGLDQPHCVSSGGRSVTITDHCSANHMAEPRVSGLMSSNPALLQAAAKARSALYTPRISSRASPTSRHSWRCSEAVALMRFQAVWPRRMQRDCSRQAPRQVRVRGTGSRGGRRLARPSPNGEPWEIKNRSYSGQAKRSW